VTEGLEEPITDLLTDRQFDEMVGAAQPRDRAHLGGPTTVEAAIDESCPQGLHVALDERVPRLGVPGGCGVHEVAIASTGHAAIAVLTAVPHGPFRLRDRSPCGQRKCHLFTGLDTMVLWKICGQKPNYALVITEIATIRIDVLRHARNPRCPSGRRFSVRWRCVPGEGRPIRTVGGRPPRRRR